MKAKASKLNAQESVEIHLGSAGTLVGNLTYVRQGQRELSQFAYASTWLDSPDGFEISPDLPFEAGHATRRASSKVDAVFHSALSDSAPDAWGRRVIERAHAKARKENPNLAPRSELDYLCAVDDFSRVGALRLHKSGTYLQTVDAGRRTTPPLLELEHMYSASRAIENNKETVDDLKYLQGKGTSLGGMRPKCTVLDETGKLAIGKFPSVNDTFNVTRGEVLALVLSRRAGINTATARAISVKGTAVALIERFDRAPGDKRIPYLSAASMLQASREETRAYTEIVDVMRQRCANPDQDARELWRRLAFNLLITNTDDHLQNHGFLYAGEGQWKLAPSFDVNPMPGKLRESKTWLSEDTGPIESVQMLLDAAPYFSLTTAEAHDVLAGVLAVVEDWKKVALSDEVGLTAPELTAFEDAFEHEVTEQARRLRHIGP
ncbi:type II toxin-antitoxin system HipA family toxin [Noviherbaspirillum sedimenti]|uniref:Type II toxin-antitoxin system HipA family toxin n=1 Tax=Noviherbaspirillum sedimenti TaxID=2320865 RepID=A0A3A3GNT2_9BURK|nr:HipA domain-containing protein [Noviherbaspirillum sedimenti]RJG02610.1 type II toxin-antitoxin system HipA family toxin [Noviherbaspirillum sedimenti]